MTIRATVGHALGFLGLLVGLGRCIRPYVSPDSLRRTAFGVSDAEYGNHGKPRYEDRDEFLRRPVCHGRSSLTIKVQEVKAIIEKACGGPPSDYGDVPPPDARVTMSAYS
jgi:hypothetical protein